jgi:hypothetical protein
MQADLMAYSFAKSMGPDKALQLLTRHGVASCIAAPD